VRDPESVAVVEGDAAAALLAHPLRRRIVAELREPGSASSVAQSLGLPRQKVNYHLRALEAAGLLEAVEERARRGCIERVVRARARAFVLVPAGIGDPAIAPGDAAAARAPSPPPADAFAAEFLLAASARTLREVAALRAGAAAAKKRLATLSLDGEVALAGAAELAEFRVALTAALADVIDRFHRPGRPGARVFRVLALAHPKPRSTAAHEGVSP
jgi:DNA-binding transcriptional ArsR family regulator